MTVIPMPVTCTETFAGPEYVSSKAVGAMRISSIKPALNSIPRFKPFVIKAKIPDKISKTLRMTQGTKPLLKCITFLLIF